ncbi:protein kinase [Planctomycetota bacterium]
MGSEQSKVEALYHAALEKDSEAERTEFLDAACGDEPAIRARVNALLRANEEAGPFLQFRPAFQGTQSGWSSEVLGTRIGSHKLIEKMGEGGMAVVYLAEQEQPIRRRVALKIIKPGMDSKQVIARFAAERQTLAMMDHPNIAKVHDAGVDEGGHPYFIMEFVEGVSITRHCDEHKLTIEQRLAIFKQICEGVHHAHQKGIIHRDIKPSNILVHDLGVRAIPKIIDFGIAKAIAEPLTDTTFVTRHGQLVGTPEYMSPEQVDMATQDIDTRSDIYSLGVLLYELLAGVLPYERESFKNGLNQIQRTIQEEEPATPSTRLTSLGEEAKEIAERRQTQLQTLARCLHRELEWIPMKAMRKDRNRRYRSASELADDIQNYLDGRPLIAGPESSAYRVKKFVRKHAGSVATASLLLVVIILGLVASILMGCRAEQARKKEATARKQVEQALVRAENAEKVAQERAEDYRHSLYFNQIALADASYRDGNISRVRELLDLCPGDLRGWEWNRLEHISNSARLTLSGHQIYATCIAYSPDGKRIVSGGVDNTLKLWDADTGKEQMTLRGHEEGITSVAFNSDGNRIISADSSGIIKVWDARTGSEVRTLQAHNKGIRGVSFGPGDEHFVSGADDGTIKVWDINTGNEVMVLSGQRPFVIACSPDGKWIASGTRDATIVLWDSQAGDEKAILRGHELYVSSVAFSPDSKWIVSGGSEGTIKVWDIATGSEVKSLRAHDGYIRAISFSPDGGRIVSGGDDNVIKVWGAETGALLMTLLGHEGYVVATAFSPNGKWIASAGGNTVKVWDAIIDRKVEALIGHQGNVVSVAFSPDGRHIVTGSTDKTVKIWNVATGSEVMTLHGHGNNVDATYPPWNKTMSVAFSPDGHSVVSGAFDNTIRVWDAANGLEVTTLQGHSGPVNSVAVSPDGKRIISASDDKTLKLWDAKNYTELMTFRGHEITYAVFSPEGKRVVSAGENVKVWDVETGTELMTLDSGDDWVSCVSINPSGKNIVSGYGDGTIIIWDTATGTKLITRKAHKDSICSLAFSPDGNRIISGSWQNVKIWDMSTGTELITLRGSGNSIAFSPDGKTIAIGSDNDTIGLWESEQPVDGYGARRTGVAARKLVDKLHKEHGFYSKVTGKLKADETLDESLREVALQIANARLWEDAEKQKKEASLE